MRLEPSGRTLHRQPRRNHPRGGAAPGRRPAVRLPQRRLRGLQGHAQERGRSPTASTRSARITEAEKAAGKALTCCTKPQSDIVLEIRELAGLKDLAIRTLPARVERIEKPAEDVAILYLKLPAAERLQFLAGQYIDILMKGGVRRSYSMANAPHDDTHLQLHVRRTPGGAFSKYVFEEMKERAIIRFEGPLGSFYLREDSDKPMILVAGGTGFAPIKAVIEHAFHKGIDRQMVLYWGVRIAARPVPARSCR